MSDRLAVWLGGSRIGTLERTSPGELRYVPDVAASLSVAADGIAPWSRDLTRNWFDGLLPEEGRRARVANRFGLRPEDTFGLLEQIGWECAGAVAVMPEGRIPAQGEYHAVSDQQIAERLDALPVIIEPDDEAIRMSLGGAQEKLLVARVGESWALTIDGSPSTHILKPEPPRWPGLVLAEAWALTAAGAATTASEVSVSTELGSRPVLVVKRYDRVVRNGVITRIHQEDLCQALGLPAAAKYVPRPPRPDSPSFARLAEILRERAADPPAELARLLAQVVISVALQNADLHAKNLSILNRDGVVELTPVYDVAPTTAFIPGQTTVGLPIGGKYKLTEIGIDHFVREARSWGLPEQTARTVVADTVAGLQRGIELADALYPHVPREARELAVAGVFQAGLDRPGSRGPVTPQPNGRSD